MPMSSGNYGKELILDLHDCDVRLITEPSLERFLDVLCVFLEMEQVQRHWWKDLANEEPHLAGISVVQFIRTSNVTVHALTKIQCVCTLTCFRVRTSTQKKQQHSQQAGSAVRLLQTMS